MSTSNYIWTPEEFHGGGYSLGELGDIRTIVRTEAVENLTRIATERCIESGGIALLGARIDDNPKSLAIPEHGLVYPIYPSPNDEEWEAFAQDFRGIEVPGQLHAYDRNAVTLPI